MRYIILFLLGLASYSVTAAEPDTLRQIVQNTLLDVGENNQLSTLQNSADGFTFFDNSGQELFAVATIRTVEGETQSREIRTVWRKGGEEQTSGGDRVIWGFFYANPEDVSWGSFNNPDVYLKVWIDRSGRVDVNFFHVSVPDIFVATGFAKNGAPTSAFGELQSTVTLNSRYVRHYLPNGGDRFFRSN
ncbi:hypothetical protein [Beggiatoa leptomitoformis]|uniref:Uncharacterized protein n=1 Tax=Beggiatoa leptomitoformis TaxID=288004 RepID=A0A2N9YAP9_9GAMM|nr:hypothetical protein [Beggiatoa leptomitoformis]ALG67089.1 hypothetical protein AL038_04370 [Beggiatoa leptomitoformis]AUI67519.1 hypothetical protein BLE401_01635 [Beggiatoa leptomitoformis]